MSARRDKEKQPNKTKREFELSRRTMIKLSAAAGAGTVLSPMILTSRKSTVYAQGTVAEPELCGTVANPSPPHTPFLDNLPIPSPAIPQFLSPTPTKFCARAAEVLSYSRKRPLNIEVWIKPNGLMRAAVRCSW